MKRTEKVDKIMARDNAKRLLERDFKCLLVSTETGMMYNGSGADFLAVLSTIINKAYTELGLPKEAVEYACELGLNDDDEDDDEEDNKFDEAKEEVKEKILELLETMKKQLEK